MAFDAFISHSAQDKTIADAACATLEKMGIRCWIAPRDIPAGSEWAGAIVDAIDNCQVLVLILSSHANSSSQVHREIERGVNKGKPIIPFRVEDVRPTSSMEYYLASIHWLDALTPPLEKHLLELAQTAKGCLTAKGRLGVGENQNYATAPASATTTAEQISAPKPGRVAVVSEQKASKSLPTFTVASLALIVALIVGGGVFFYIKSSQKPPAASTSDTSSASHQPDYTGWLAPADFQKVFDAMVQSRQYPKELQAALINGTWMIRALFAPYPTKDFNFFSYFGMTAQDFAEKDSAYGKLGYVLAYRQSVTDGGPEFIQAVWIRY